MEFIKGNPREIKVGVPATAEGIVVEFFFNGTAVGLVQELPVVAGIIEFTPPYAAVAEEGVLKIEVSFVEQSDYHTKTIYGHVVSSYLEIWELRDILNTIDDDACWALEKAVRTIIDSHTGQSFGLSKETITVPARRDESLKLPKRLLSLNSIQSYEQTFETNAFNIISDGWYLERQRNDFYETRQAPPEDALLIPDAYGYKIRATSNGKTYYSVDGEWGYYGVPDAVQAAATLLASDYGCPEVGYRDSYLENIKAADWRLQFSEKSWDFTGNVRADHLLSRYVLLDWAIV